MLLLNLRSEEQPRPPAAHETSVAAADLARRLRPRFQLALLGWIRGEHLERSLNALADVAAQLEAHATTQPLFQLWWVAGAVLEALRQGGIDGNVSVKRLLGQADREMRRLYEHGEDAYAAAPPVELLNNLLFYVGRATGGGPRRKCSTEVTFPRAHRSPIYSKGIDHEQGCGHAPSGFPRPAYRRLPEHRHRHRPFPDEPPLEAMAAEVHW